MRRVALAVVVLVAAATGLVAAQSGTETVDCEFPVTATDATGESVTVPAEPERVVVLAPSAAQTVWEIGAEEKVVGMPVTQYTAYLNGSTERTNVVGADGRPVQSRVVELDPDLVLAPNVVRNGTVENLRRANLTVYRFRLARSLADVYAKTELTGRLLGEFESAARTSARMQATVGAVARATEGRERPDVYYVLGGGWTAGAGTFIDDLIAKAGGRNVAAAANVSGYQQISPEVVASRDPDWIVLPGGTSLPANPAVNGTTAVQEGQIVRVNANYVNQPGPRTTIPLRTMAGAFHPDANIDVAGVETPAPARCASAPTATSGDDGTSPTADGSGTVAEPTATRTATPTPGARGPGFTAVLALVALAGGLLVARRR